EAASANLEVCCWTARETNRAEVSRALLWIGQRDQAPAQTRRGEPARSARRGAQGDGGAILVPLATHPEAVVHQALAWSGGAWDIDESPGRGHRRVGRALLWVGGVEQQNGPKAEQVLPGVAEGEERVGPALEPVRGNARRGLAFMSADHGQ